MAVRALKSFREKTLARRETELPTPRLCTEDAAQSGGWKASVALMVACAVAASASGVRTAALIVTVALLVATLFSRSQTACRAVAHLALHFLVWPWLMKSDAMQARQTRQARQAHEERVQAESAAGTEHAAAERSFRARMPTVEALFSMQTTAQSSGDGGGSSDAGDGHTGLQKRAARLAAIISTHHVRVAKLIPHVHPPSQTVFVCKRALLMPPPSRLAHAHASLGRHSQPR